MNAIVALTALAFGGPSAPALTVDHWLPEAPSLTERIVVVEVWATWCGPCRESFPTLARLQADHADRLTVVALTDEGLPLVRRFVADHPELKGLSVAVASEEVVQGFLFGGFEGRGIPSTYVIEAGEVRWSGPPDALEAALGPMLVPKSPAAREE